MPKYKWTVEQVEYLRKNYMDKSQKQMQKEIGVHSSVIQRKIKELGWPAKKTGRSTKLSPAVKEYLQANYNRMTNLELGRALNLTKNTIRIYLDQLGLVKVKATEQIEPPEKQTNVVIQYYNRGATGSKVLTVNESSYKRAKRRAIDLAVNYMGYERVRVIE